MGCSTSSYTKDADQLPTRGAAAPPAAAAAWHPRAVGHLLSSLAPGPYEHPHEFSKMRIVTKQGCSFCTRAKALLDEHSIEYSEESPPPDFAQLMQAFGQAKTVPQIWLGGRYIGGLVELQAHLRETGGGRRGQVRSV